MASSISGLETFDTGSNYPFNNETPAARPPRDVFDLSHLHTTTLDNAGLVIPISFWKTVPGDSFDINVSSLLRVLPQVVPLYSRQRGYIHAFYARYTDLFDYATTYLTKGYAGTTIMQKPVMTEENMGDYWTKKIAPGDLLDYLGLPQGYSPEEITEVTGPISVLLPFMYWKIVNQFYRNKNTQINDRVRLPDDFSELRLNRENDLISNKYADDNNPAVTFGDLLVRDWASDYFTSGFPSPQRGTAPTLSGDVVFSDDIRFKMDSAAFTNVPVVNRNNSNGYNINPESGLPVNGASGTEVVRSLNNFGGANISGLVGGSGTALSYAIGESPRFDSGSSSSPSLSYQISSTRAAYNYVASMLRVDNTADFSLDLGVTLENIRKLAISQDELERMAKTDGTFAAFGNVFFGVVSRNALDFQVTYIGGSYQQINFSEVVQSSNSTDSSPLGNYAGHGISSQTNGNLGHIDCDEYGYVMLLFSVMPDTYYFQGVDSDWTELFQDEEYLPQREKIGLVPVYNRELFFSQEENRHAPNEAVTYKANDLFVYQAPFDHLRYKNNRISGKIADKTNKSFSPYTQARIFESTPEWNDDFLLARDVRKDYLFAPSEIAYTAQFQINVRAVRPLPFFHTPAQIV